MSATLTTIQCKIINETPFVIDDTINIGFPMAPLTSVFVFEDNGVKKIKIRTVLFIDSSATEQNLGFVHNVEKNILSITSDYKFREESPESFNCYYVELDYSSDAIENITTVTCYLRDLDPKTSRGTSTSVIWS